MNLEVENAPIAEAESYLSRLNTAQRIAVEHGTGGAADEPLLVIAGAGSGKTNTLAHRVTHVIAQGANPGAILLLTFSRRAADEMAHLWLQVLPLNHAGETGDPRTVLAMAGQAAHRPIAGRYSD